MGKSTISMAMFNSYVNVYQRVDAIPQRSMAESVWSEDPDTFDEKNLILGSTTQHMRLFINGGPLKSSISTCFFFPSWYIKPSIWGYPPIYGNLNLRICFLWAEKTLELWHWHDTETCCGESNSKLDDLGVPPMNWKPQYNNDHQNHPLVCPYQPSLPIMYIVEVKFKTP